MSGGAGVELVWRSVVGLDGGYAEWVRELSDCSGVYLIRSDPARFDDELLYIGESHTHHGRDGKRSYRGLYRTLTRHFHGHGWEQGITYDPADVLVAAIIATPEQAIEYQDMLINQFKPRDNELVRQMRLEAWGMSAEESELDADEFEDEDEGGDVPF